MTTLSRRRHCEHCICKLNKQGLPVKKCKVYGIPSICNCLQNGHSVSKRLSKRPSFWISFDCLAEKECQRDLGKHCKQPLQMLPKLPAWRICYHPNAVICCRKATEPFFLCLLRNVWWGRRDPVRSILFVAVRVNVVVMHLGGWGTEAYLLESKWHQWDTCTTTSCFCLARVVQSNVERKRVNSISFVPPIGNWKLVYS